MKKIILAGISLCLLTGMAQAQEKEPYQCGYGGLNNKPVVPTEKVAGEIFHAVAGGYSPYLLKKFPDVTIKDGGDHWVVSQMNLGAAEKQHLTNGSDMVMIKKKGQLTLYIDKCIGTITKAAIAE